MLLRCNIFLISLLVYAVCASHWEIREVDSAEDQDEEFSADGMPKQPSSTECTLCKIIMMGVKMALSSKPAVDEIKTKLNKACDVLKQQKVQCKHFVEKYLNKLIKELMTSDGPNTICTKILICQKHKGVFVHGQAHDNF